MRPPKRLIAAIAGLLIATGAAAQGEGAASLPAISVSTVARAALVARAHASGLIEAVERVLVAPQIEGQAIEAIEVEVGDWVEAGDVLARLSDAALALERSQLDASRASAEAEIAQAEAQLVEAEAIRDEALRDQERAVGLAERGATSEAAADEARSAAATSAARVSVAVQGLNAALAQLRVVDAQIADVDLQLRRTAVTAPVAGEITERTAMVGAIASMAGEPLFAIVRDGALELRADVAERDILALAPGQDARITAVGLAAPLAGVTRLVEPTVDATSRLGRVRIAIAEPGRVRAGMFADAEILLRATDAPALPVSAIGEDAEGASVLRVRDGIVERVRITTGIRDGGLIEVVAGLALGDTVVTRAGAFVRDGDRINPVPAEAAGVSN